MKKIFFSLSLFLCISGFSQDFKWAKTTTLSNNDDKMISSVTDVFGNVYVIGNWNVDPTINIGGTILSNIGTAIETFLVKYDSLGNVVWAKKAASSSTDDIVYAMGIDSSGNIFIAGILTSQPTTFDTISVYDPSAIYLTKFDNSGNALWVKRFYGGPTVIRAMDVDVFGNVFMTGSFRNPLTFGGLTLNSVDTTVSSDIDIFLVKLDNNGNPLWVRGAGSADHDEAYAIDIDLNGNPFITGHFNGTSVIFGSDTLISLYSTGTSIFIAKYDAAGNVVWANQSKGTFLSILSDFGGIAVDGIGNSYIAGVFDSDTLKFDTLSLVNTGSWDMFLVKYDALGNAVAAICETGMTFNNQPFSMTKDLAGNIYTAAHFNTGKIEKYSSNLTLLWQKYLFGSGSSANINFIASINVDNFGHVYVVGRYLCPTLSFDAITITNADPSASRFDSFVACLSAGTATVWPGDANHDYVANNYDLLPIGVYYGQTGSPRSSISNSWLGYAASDWGTIQANGQDIKHVDCNGDSTINIIDTIAINLNFSLAHAFVPQENDIRSSHPNLFFSTSSATFNGGDIVIVEIWAGNATLPVENLYGIAFDFNYDLSLVEFGTASLSYPAGWLGIPGTNTITIQKVDPSVGVVYGAETRIDHMNADGYGKIAEFKFQAKNTISVPTTMNFSFLNHGANDSANTEVLLNSLSHSILINPVGTNIDNVFDDNGIKIFPTPYSGSTQISYSLSGKSVVTVEVFNTIGQKIETLVNAEQQAGEYKYTFSAKQNNFGSGVYLVKIAVDGNTTTKKIIEIQ